jgi:sugar (pentulose or hexulose) kinase
MSTSAHWCQLLADVSGHQLRVRPLSRVAGIAGAVLVAGDETLAHVDDDEVLVYERRSSEAVGQRDGHARYQQIYESLQHDYDIQPAGNARAR